MPIGLYMIKAKNLLHIINYKLTDIIKLNEKKEKWSNTILMNFGQLCCFLRQKWYKRRRQSFSVSGECLCLLKCQKTADGQTDMECFWSKRKKGKRPECPLTRKLSCSAFAIKMKWWMVLFFLLRSTWSIQESGHSGNRMLFSYFLKVQHKTVWNQKENIQ